MAVQAGTVQVEVEVELTGEARRLKALELAITHLHDASGELITGPAQVVVCAKEFEKYLAGSAEEETDGGA